jgi:hypothetical protein
VATLGSQKTLGVMPKNTQYVPMGGLIDTLSSNEKSGRFLQNSPNFLGTYNHSSSLSNTQPLQHTASFKEGSSGRDTPDGQLHHMSFKPSAGGNSFITLRPMGVPQLLMPSLDSATSASEVRI